MPRSEFTRTTKREALERANGHCEDKRCGAVLKPGEAEFDHILPCELGGTNELSNCQVLCKVCHRTKTSKQDVPRIRKSDRARDKATGALRPKQKIKSRGFEKKPRSPKPELAPRQLYRRLK